MSKVIIFKHAATMQEFVGRVTEDVAKRIEDVGIQAINTIEMERPMMIMPQPDGNGGVGIALAPFSYAMQTDTVTIVSSCLMAAREADSDFEAEYTRLTSDIQIHKTMPDIQKP